MKLKIRTKLLVTMVAIIAIAVSIVGGTSYYKSTNLITDNFIESGKELNDEIGKGLQKEYQGYLDGLSLVAKNDNFKTLEETGYTSWHKDLFQNFVEGYDVAYQVYMGTLDGKIYIYPETTFEAGYDPRQRAWYKDTMASGEPTWTDIYVSATSGSLDIAGGYPVKDNNGKMLGVVGASVNLENLSKEINEIKVGERGKIALLNQSAVAIAHSNAQAIGKETPVKEIKDQILTGQDGVVNYEYEENGEMVEKYAIITKVHGLNWFLVTTMYQSEANEQASVLIGTSIMIILASLVIASIVAWIFAQSLTKPMIQVGKDMARVKEGDMTVVCKVKSKDEVGELADSFNDMIENVRNLIQGAAGVTEEVMVSAESLAASSEEVSASADEVSRTVEEIAQGASDQAHDAESAAVLTAGLDRKFGNLDESSKSIFQKSSDIKNVNSLGVETVKGLQEQSTKSAKSTEEVVVAIYDLEKKSQAIDNILTTIKSIAEQTNLLALNASIEAARAGEHGKGFSVVADEIRKLAEESSHSAEQIAEIVTMIQNQTDHTVKIIGELKNSTEEQNKAVSAVNKSFANISNGIEDIAEAISSTEELIGTMIQDKDEIVKSITNISSVSEETAAASEEVSASMQQQTAAVETVARSAEQLNELSIQLKKDIDAFKI